MAPRVCGFARLALQPTFWSPAQGDHYLIALWHRISAVSRGIGVEIHGIVKAGQLEPPFPPVGKRMPIDVWGFEPLLKAAEGQLPAPYCR